MRRGLQAALLLAVSTAAALLAAEGIVRLARPGLVAGPNPISNPFWRHDAELGWSHRPGKRGTFSRPEFSHPVAINSMGFRGVEREPEDASSRAFRIAVFGDSFTWGHGVADEEIYTRVLEGLLDGPEVWNLGVSAYSTDQELLLFRKVRGRVRPDLVLVMVSRNDFEGNVSRRAGAYPKPWMVPEGGAPRVEGVPVPRPRLLDRLSSAARRRSALVNGLWRLAGVDGDAPRPRAGRDEEVRTTLAILDRFRSEAEGSGARFAVGFVPSTAHVYPGKVPDLEAARLDALGEWAAERGVAFLDLVPAFRSAFEATGRRLHYTQDKHWTAEGHRLAAETLARLMGEAGLLPGH